MISSRFYPQLVGSGTIAYLIAKRLADHGHEVIVLVDQALEHVTRDSYNFEVRYIPGLEAFALGEQSMKVAAEHIYKNLENIKPDTIHVYNYMPMQLINTIQDVIRCPIIFTVCNTPVIGKRTTGYFNDSSLDISLARSIIKADAFDMVMAGSRHYMESLEYLGTPKSKLYLNYFGIDFNEISLFLDHPISAIANYGFNSDFDIDEPFILLPSRITSQKGISNAIRALEIINKDFPVKLMLTGMAKPFDVGYADQMMALAKSIKVRELIIIPSSVIARHDLMVLYQKSAAILIPSKFEGLGLAAIEALAVGGRLVVSDVVGLNEIVVHELNGLVFSPNKPQAMAAAVLRVVTNNKLSIMLHKVGPESVRRFNIENHVRFLELSYERLL